MMSLETACGRHPRRVVVGIAGLLLLFAAMAWHAALLESPTYDEPTHAMAGVVSITRGDFRLNTEHPPLWKLWASLPALFAPPLVLDTASKEWQRASLDRSATPPLVQATLYHQPQNDPDAIINRARFMMLLAGVLLGGMIALWSWRLAGPLAALAAAAFFAFDPNFLGHAPLVTNDVAVSLAFLVALYATWKVGQSATPPRLLLLALACASALLVKYSGLIVAPIVLLLLMLRALWPLPWKIAGREVSTRGRRLGAVALISLACALIGWTAIWGCYGFRFHVSPDSSTRINLQENVQEEAVYGYIAEHGAVPTPAQTAAQRPSLFTRALLRADDLELLPEGFIDGLMYAHASALARPSFLLGEMSLVGRWYYFPVAVLVKTPLGTLLAIFVAMALAALVRPWKLLRRGSSSRAWDLACLILPPLAYFAFAMRSNLNIGLRHVFPIYPFLFIGIGVALVKAVRLRPRAASWGGAALTALMVAESVAASPAYLPFFNTSAGGARGGLSFLADSNLDWGQGLKLLGDWQRRHGNQLIYLWYYGTADADHYVHAISLGRPSVVSAADKPPEIIALSATMLQGLPVDAKTLQAMQLIRDTLTPLDVLGGCIYLYRAADVLPLFGWPGR